MNKKPIEIYFPIQKINKIAEKEGQAKMYYRPISTMHKWWARRLGCIFRSILLYSLFDKDSKIYDPLKKKWIKIEKYENVSKLWDLYYLSDMNFSSKTILDPFFGGGTTIIEALKMNCKVVGKELNPVAWFLTKKATDPISLEIFDRAIEKLEKEIAPEILKYYVTKCPKCENEIYAMYYFYTQEISCLTCREKVSLFNDYRIGRARSPNVAHTHLTRCIKCFYFYQPNEFKRCPSCDEPYVYNHYMNVICPQCEKIFATGDYKSENKCPFCDFIFTPSIGNASGQYYICSNGHKRKIVESIKRDGKPSNRLFALEYYCPYCDKKGYKQVDNKDLEILEKAIEEFNEIKTELIIPNQKIPNGDCMNSLLTHGFKYFKDMFNKRQLLNLGKLFNAILNFENQNLKEHLLLLFSDTLRTNTDNMYDYTKNHILNYFKIHAYHSAVNPVENNLWGLKYGRGTFLKQIEKYRKGLEYLINPFEKYRKNNTTKEKKLNFKINGKKAKNFQDLDNKNLLLLCGSSEYIEIPDKTIDAVITDPPYYDNVMYAELSDFFYVWLRNGLKDIYPFFNSELTPKRSEIIKSKFHRKSEKDYSDGLVRVFKECYKKLKNNGILVFTFHHKGIEAWIAILNTILLSDFYVSAVYPVQAEMKTSTHIIHKANIEYDMIIVCRKRLDLPKKVDWHRLQDEIFILVEKTISELEIRDNITDGDKFVIAMGKCLYVYSKNWPEIYDENNKKVSVETAINDIKNIVGNYFTKTRFGILEKETDYYTAIYFQFLYGEKDLNFNEISKAFQQRNLNINDILQRNLAKKYENKIKVYTYKERMKFLKKMSKEKMSAIDQAHYILNLKDMGRLTKENLAWVKNTTINALKRMNIKDKDRLINYIEKNRKQKKLEL
ncbi:MAG: DUF1156 domain-containing protein [Promethearchaeota archaeon]